MPVRGLGEKNVVFCGIRTPASAAARVCATDTGRTATRRARRLCRRAPRRRRRRGGTPRSRAASAGPRPTRRRAASTRAPFGLGGEHTAREPRRAGARARAPSPSTRPSAPARACGASAFDDVGRVRAGGLDGERVGERGAHVGRRPATVTRRWMARCTAGLGQFDDERHDRGRAADRPPRRALVAVDASRFRSGGARRRARAARRRPPPDRIDLRGVVDREQLVLDAVLVGRTAPSGAAVRAGR